ncbi:MAG: ATP-binding protein [bacterium]
MPIRAGIRAKLLLSFLILVVMMSLVFLVSSYSRITGAMNKEIEKRGNDIIQIFSQLSAPYVFESDYVEIQSMGKKLVEESDIEYIAIVEPDGRVWTSTTTHQIDYFLTDSFFLDIFVTNRTESRQVTKNDRTSIEFARPISALGKASYLVVASISSQTIEMEAAARLRSIILILLTMVCFALLMTIYLSRRLTQPLKDLLRGTQEIAQGNLEHRIKIQTSDEIGSLSESFNSMTSQLEHESYERQEAEKAMIEARNSAILSANSKSEFLANMSHEIRTPMNAIIGMTHLALKADLSHKPRGYIEKVSRSAENLLRILNDILDFSRIDSGKLEIEETRFSLADVLDQLTILNGVDAEKKGQALIIDIAPDIPTMLVGDPLRLTQILTNLVNNAIKFSEDSSEIVISVRLQCDSEDSVKLHFSIKDFGVGITEEQRQLLFLPFSQGDTSTTRQYGGSGLGLAICKNLVEIMGGEIWVESEADVGSAFQFTVKLKKQLGASSLITKRKIGPDQVVENAIHQLQGAKLLLVEDNEINREIIIELLVPEGVEIIVAQNGEEALARLDAEIFDGVLMDCQMPIMDGYTASRLIREQTRFRNLPIIAMTADALHQDRDKALKAGMNDHISKPISFDDMFIILAKWIKLGS